MKIFKQIIAILAISFISGLGFNAFSPRGINVFDNPWSRNAIDAPAYQLEQSVQWMQEEPIIFVDFDQACRFIEDQEGMILDARTPEDYKEGHIPGAHPLFFYNMNEYYTKLESRLLESPVILTYCGDFNCEDSEFLANELFNLGHVPILVYKGGFEEWKAHQMPVEKSREEAQG